MVGLSCGLLLIFFFQAEDGIRDLTVTGVQTCALPISLAGARRGADVGIDRRGGAERPAAGARPPRGHRCIIDAMKAGRRYPLLVRFLASDRKSTRRTPVTVKSRMPSSA